MNFVIPGGAAPNPESRRSYIEIPGSMLRIVPE